MKVFISYHRKDKMIADLIKHELKLMGVFPLSVNLFKSVGNNIFDELEAVIPNVDYVIAVLSKTSINNDWMNKEFIAFFLKENLSKTKIIIPVVIEQCKIPDFLNDGRKSFDLRNQSKEKLKEVVEYISSKRQSFVIMKLGDPFLDSMFDGVIEPVLIRFNYAVVRIDKVEDSGRISEQVLNQIARSEIVLADLTGERPNCYYEAGYAHALGKEIIFTVRSEEKVHFDLAGNRFIIWKTENDLRRALIKRLEAIQKRAKQAN